MCVCVCVCVCICVCHCVYIRRQISQYNVICRMVLMAFIYSVTTEAVIETLSTSDVDA